MSISFNPTRLIVGFRDWFTLDDYRSHQWSSAEEMAASALRRASGFESIVEKFELLNAVLVRINPREIDQFVSRVRHLDEVEYCENDFHLEACSYTDLLHRSHLQGIPQDSALSFHRSRHGALASGVGSTVALIDTGLSPHPYLPALSFQEAKAKSLTRHESVCTPATEAFINAAAQLERQYKDPYTNTTRRQAFNSQLLADFESFIEFRWSAWEAEIRTWIGQTRRQPPPAVPKDRAMLGAMRVIGPHSWNFVDDTPNILDRDGHGTAMAGCIAALPPISTGILPAISPVLNTDPRLSSEPYAKHLSTLEQDVVGLAPYAELLVLKCMETRKADESTLSKLLKALAYCLKVRPDCIYVGFALKNQPQAPLMSLTRTTTQVAAAGITIFAPAGNEGKAGVRAPAACPGVLPIAAAEIEKGTGRLVRSKFSSFADVSNQEEIAFCAQGGGDVSPMLTLSTDFGFSYEYGTSISAAVVAAVFANTAAAHYQGTMDRLYRSQVGAHGQIVPLKVRQSIENWQPVAADVAMIFADVRASVFATPASNSQQGDPELGLGLPRI